MLRDIEGDELQDDLQDDLQRQLKENHILRVCTALGGKRGNEYILGDEAVGCLKDLKRFLRRDEQQGDRFTHLLLGRWNIVSSDLVPILVLSVAGDNLKLALAACEVLVPLTWPLETSAGVELEVLRQYKQCFLDSGVWEALLTIILKLIAIPIGQRSENDNQRLRLVVSLIRNILAIDDQQDRIISSTSTYMNSTCQVSSESVYYLLDHIQLELFRTIKLHSHYITLN